MKAVGVDLLKSTDARGFEKSNALGETDRAALEGAAMRTMPSGLSEREADLELNTGVEGCPNEKGREGIDAPKLSWGVFDREGSKEFAAGVAGDVKGGDSDVAGDGLNVKDVALDRAAGGGVVGRPNENPVALGGSDDVEPNANDGASG